MAHTFRYFGKKRGNRRTGVPLWGTIGECLFSAVFLALGCSGLPWMISRFVVPEWRVNHEFVETTCRVLAKRIDERDSGESGVLYRPEFKIEYKADGVVYRDWRYDIQRAYSSKREAAQAACDGFELYAPHRKVYPCWYDPAVPSIAVLVRGYRWTTWLLLTVPLSFLMIGAGGLIHASVSWGKSAERRSAAARRGEDRLSARNAGDVVRFPFVPKGADMTNSPGTKLKYRLPMSSSPGWAMFWLLAFCVVWNGIVAPFAVLAVRAIVLGKPDWTLTIFTLPFAVIGLGAIVLLLRQLLVTTGIGPTLVEISAHPIRPGRRYHVFVSQSGRLTVNTLRVSLVCEETASYRQGTNTRTEAREVFRQMLLQRDDFRIESASPFEAELELELPENAMHSFMADHNEIGWSLSIECDAAGWPKRRRKFPIVVRPAVGGEHP